jgi:hypothetical protein
MPLLSACQLPPPSNWQDFESLCADLWREELQDQNVQRIGRAGQAQHGVDICGQTLNSGWVGIQCKCIRADLALTEIDLVSKVQKARDFRPRLSHYIIANTGLKDIHIEALCRQLTTEQLKGGGFSVNVRSWADICSLLHRHQTVARIHFPFVITSVPLVLNNEIEAPGQRREDLRYSFVREEFIHPRIVEELLGFISDRHETVVSVDLSSANRSNRFFGPINIIQDRDGQWVHCDQESDAYFRYKHLGTSNSGIHVLWSVQGGGGTGHFNDLQFLTLQRDTGLARDEGNISKRERVLLKTLGSIPIGDRYSGVLEGRFLNSSRLTTQVGRLDRARFLQEADELLRQTDKSSIFCATYLNQL